MFIVYTFWKRIRLNGAPIRVADGFGDGLARSVGQGVARAPWSEFWGRRASRREALALPSGW
jgi:hypothetical protein